METINIKYSGYTIKNALKSGGKAGKNNNKTSTIQVIQEIDSKSYLLRKQFRFTIDNEESLLNSINKAKIWADANPPIKI